MLAAIAGGAVFGLLHGLLVVSLGLSQHVTGLGITLFASSFTYYVYRLVIPVSGSPPTIVPFQPLAIPGLSSLPFFGEALFSQAAPTYLAVGLALLMAYALAHTPLGLAIRLVGENPHAAEAQGIDPIALRLAVVAVGSALMSVGGSFLTTAAFNSFFPTMVQGRGWVCIALVVFASWRPGRALGGALLFAFCDAFQLRLQHVIGKAVPYQLFLMLPYLISILALLLVARRARVPQALMAPYRRGER
jgi:general nucleoside transport system permease protein